MSALYGEGRHRTLRPSEEATLILEMEKILDEFVDSSTEFSKLSRYSV
jgi:hypothetical protein